MTTNQNIRQTGILEQVPMIRRGEKIFYAGSLLTKLQQCFAHSGRKNGQNSEFLSPVDDNLRKKNLTVKTILIFPTCCAIADFCDWQSRWVTRGERVSYSPSVPCLFSLQNQVLKYLVTLGTVPKHRNTSLNFRKPSKYLTYLYRRLICAKLIYFTIPLF